MHCIIIAEHLKISSKAVAGALQISTDRIGNLINNRIAICGSLKVPLTRTNRHMAGKRLSKKQRAANERSSGMNQQFYVNQIIDLIEADLLDTENQKLMERLLFLDKLLKKVLAALVA